MVVVFGGLFDKKFLNDIVVYDIGIIIIIILYSLFYLFGLLDGSVFSRKLETLNANILRFYGNIFKTKNFYIGFGVEDDLD